MAASVVNKAQGFSPGWDSASVVSTAAISSTSGSAILAIVWGSVADPADYTVSDNMGNTASYQLVASTSKSGSFKGRAWLATGITGGAGHIVSVESDVPSSYTVLVYEVSGLDANAVDVVVIKSGDACCDVFDTPTGVLVQPDEILFSSVAFNTGGVEITAVDNTGTWVEQDNTLGSPNSTNFIAVAVFSKIVSSTLSQPVSLTGGGGSWIPGFTVTLKASSGAPGSDISGAYGQAVQAHAGALTTSAPSFTLAGIYNQALQLQIGALETTAPVSALTGIYIQSLQAHSGILTTLSGVSADFNSSDSSDEFNTLGTISTNIILNQLDALDIILVNSSTNPFITLSQIDSIDTLSVNTSSNISGSLLLTDIADLIIGNSSFSILGVTSLLDTSDTLLGEATSGVSLILGTFNQFDALDTISTSGTISVLSITGIVNVIDSLDTLTSLVFTLSTSNNQLGKLHSYLSIRPSKTVVDIHTIIEDVSQFLSPAESLMDVTSSVEVFQGIDPAPLEVLGPNAIYIQGNNIIQQIQAGLPGVVYNVLLFGTTNFGNIIEVTVRQAVLPLEVGTFIFPAQLGIFTSPLYPYQFSESIGTSVSINNAKFFNWPVDTIQLQVSILGGTLVEPLVLYNSPPENISITSAIISGTLVEPLVLYNAPPENITISTVLFSGALNTVLITYNNYPLEQLSFTVSLVSGDLT